MNITLYSVREAIVCIRKHAAIDQERRASSRVREDGESINGGGSSPVLGAISMDSVRVRNVNGLLVRREADAIGPPEAIRDNADIAGRGHEAVNVLRQLGLRTETLLVAVYGVCEPDRTVGVNNDVIGGVERPGIVIVYKGASAVWALGFHVDKAGRFLQ